MTNQPENASEGERQEVIPPAPNQWRPHRSNRLFTTHPPEKCAGNFCPVHSPSKHHMRDWPQNYREDAGITERICPHGVGHPDPDDIRAIGVMAEHGCDGCCDNSIEVTPDAPTAQSETPEVDAELRRIEADEEQYEDRHDCYVELAKFARDLERRARASEARNLDLYDETQRLSATIGELGERRAEELPRLTAELAELRKSEQRLRGALEMIYDKYEEGASVREEGQDEAMMGKAVKLTTEEEDEILAAISAPSSPGDEWRSMDSAPKDRAVLLWREGLEHAFIGDCGPTRGGLWYIYGGGSIWIQDNQPTRWRELPPPPSEGRVAE